jgi:DNA-binding MarR family transcriptional regulator
VDANLSHLVTSYVARRDLVPVMKRELLNAEREVKLEEAEILLDLFRARSCEQQVISLDSQGFTTLKQIEMARMLSQPQVNRQVRQLLLRERRYLEVRSPRRKTGALEVRLTKKGTDFAERYWADYKKFASSILAGIGVSQRRSHVSVNYAMQRKIHGLAFPRPPPTAEVVPVDNLISIFVTAKDLRLAIERSVVLPEEGLSVERADLLVILYLGHPNFMSFGAIERSLVHSFSPSRHLISRWIGEMGPEGGGFVQTQPLPGKRMAAALTEKGVAEVKPVWERYEKLADALMSGVSKEDRVGHLLVNQGISGVIRPRIEDLIVGKSSRPRSR